MSACGDVEVDVRDRVAGGDRVAVRGIVRGPRRAAPVRHWDAEGWFAVAQSWFYGVGRGRITELWRLPTGWEWFGSSGPTPLRRSDGTDTTRRRIQTYD